MSHDSGKSNPIPEPSPASDSLQHQVWTMQLGSTRGVTSGFLAAAESSDPGVVSIATITMSGMETLVEAQAKAPGTATLTVYSNQPGQPPAKSFIDVTVTA